MPLKPVNNKLALFIVLIISILLAVMILNTDKKEAAKHEHQSTSHDNQHDDHHHEESGLKNSHAHPEMSAEMTKGPHGGKLFTQGVYSVEITIFEQHTSPEFRLYTYFKGQPLAPEASHISMRLQRLGRDMERINFAPEKNYLKGDTLIQEPHSFDVDIRAQYNNKSYQFDYEQVEARVTITDEQLRHNSIEILTAGPAKIQSTVNLQGEVKLNADKSVHIVPRVGGSIQSVTANAGDTVRKGQVLASVSSQLVADIRSELLSAQKEVSLSKEVYQREKQLWEEKISAKQDYLQAQKQFNDAQINAERLKQKLGALGAKPNSNNLTHYDIRSPINGVITQKSVRQGQVVDGVESIFEVADLSTVWVELLVYAKDLRTVKPGQQVTVKSSAIDAQTIGTIAYVSALVGQQSRTATARIVLDNTNRTWPPGLPVNVALVANEISVPVAVSTEGLQTLNDWQVVFGRYGDDFEARPIKIGRRDARYIEVLEGLTAGESYAAGNSFIIKADLGKAGASHDH